MKKTFSLVFLVLCVAATAVMAMERSFTNFFFGVKAKFTVRVVDENGKPVEGAKVWASFNMEHRGKSNVDEKLTDAAGVAEVSGRCHSSVGMAITKDGYYRTWHAIRFFEEGYDIQDGKWQPYGSFVKFTLKKIHRPTPMVVFTNLKFPVPECDRDYGFDMEYGALVEPYGPGKVADFYVRYMMEGAPYVMSGNKESGGRSITLTFPNCLDGAYPIDLDVDSELQSPHQADPQANYTKEITLKATWGREIIGYKQETLEENQGLVLRTRTKVDTEGNLISAHYGEIYGKWDILGQLTKQWPFINNGGTIFFNPAENDTSLEFDNQEHYELKKGNLIPLGNLLAF